MFPFPLRIGMLLLSFLLAGPEPDSVRLEGYRMPENRTVQEYLRRHPSAVGCNIYPYSFCRLQDTPAPKGYEPVYVSHYGRHGSRNGDSTLVWFQEIERVLSMAEDQGLLTPAGRDILAESRQLAALDRGDKGHLTPVGIAQHERIARRLYRRYPAIFRKGAGVRACSSTVPRCLVSMAAFCSGLRSLGPDLRIGMDTGPSIMGYIFPETPRSENVMSQVGRLFPDVDTTTFSTLLFTDQETARRLCPRQASFQRTLVKAGCYAPGMGVEDRILAVIPPEELYQDWSRRNMGLYVMYADCIGYGEKRVPYVMPLWQDIVSKADEALASGEVACDLRFGHDFPLLALCGLLQVAGVGDRLSPREGQQRWYAFEQLCMASNIQFVFYRNPCRPDAPVLVKVLYQEREAALRGIVPFEGPYYRWSDLKQITADRWTAKMMLGEEGRAALEDLAPVGNTPGDHPSAISESPHSQ